MELLYFFIEWIPDVVLCILLTLNLTRGHEPVTFNAHFQRVSQQHLRECIESHLLNIYMLAIQIFQCLFIWRTIQIDTLYHLPM